MMKTGILALGLVAIPLTAVASDFSRYKAADNDKGAVAASVDVAPVVRTASSDARGEVTETVFAPKN